MSHPYEDELRVGLAVVRSAARICQVVQAAITPEVLDKKDNSPVTVADFASQAVICHGLSQSFPADPIIAEEDSMALHQEENEGFLREIHALINAHYQTATHNEICDWIDRGGSKEFAPRQWTLDPIDGTKGFLRKEQYAISLALIVDGQLKVGILGCPNLGTTNNSGDSLYYAVAGVGAFATQLNESAEVRQIHVTKTTDSSAARFCESYESGHSSHNESAQIASRLGITESPVRIDSQAKYALVAGGEADIYLRLPAKTGYFEKIWDHAGGVLIVQEAGGTVSDLQGKPLDFSKGRELRENRGVIVTNGALQATILAAAQAVTAASQAGG
ncbi:3'(2'),5'-bisphosphate nucleotidase [Schlesneria sp. T3-172]|uniref:3'(2'),5'-bisphosphate nucleotidase n=1 Tax=Schlesneria TaxID=656899 RepID=UPI002EEC19C2